METKRVQRFEIKNADRGEVEAVVSTFNVVDRDGDVVLPGAIEDGTKVKVSDYGHSAVVAGAPPVGKGILETSATRAVLRGQFFMSTRRGREAFHMVQELGGDSEWSVGFLRPETSTPSEEWKAKGARRLIRKMPVFETSPVMIGANGMTWTVATKCDGCRAREQRSPGINRADMGVLASQCEATLKTAERILARSRGEPLPARFAHAVTWTQRRFAMRRSQAPVIRVVDGNELPQEGATGAYIGDADAVYVRSGLPDDETLAVVFHEHAHAYERMKGWLHSERFAEGMERDLWREWHRAGR